MTKKGFTLIELLIVIAIIGIIAAIAVPNLLVALQKGKQKATMGDMKTIGTGVESYITDLACAPPGIANSNDFPLFWNKRLIPTDGWKNTWAYSRGTAANVEEYSIGSPGRDRGNVTFTAATGDYLCSSLTHFGYDIIFSNGVFTYSPKVKN